MDPLFRKRQQLMVETAACSQETLNGLMQIKAVGCEAPMLARYKEKARAFAAHLIRLEKGCTAIDAALKALGGLQSVLLAAQTLSGNISRAVSSLNFFQLRLNAASAARVFEVLDELLPGPKGEVFAPKPGAPLVSFENVSFSYPQRPDIPALQNVSFTLNKGEKAAVVGPSGSGKSSLLKLIAGFYAPDSGILRRNEENWTMISQDTFLFADAHYQNIACGDFSARKEAVEKAASEAELAGFIHSAPEGFQTFCQEQGRDLSAVASYFAQYSLFCQSDRIGEGLFCRLMETVLGMPYHISGKYDIGDLKSL